MKPNLKIFISLSLLIGIGNAVGQDDHFHPPEVHRLGNNEKSLLEAIVNRLTRLETDYQEDIKVLKHQLGLAFQEIGQLKEEKSNNKVINNDLEKSPKASIPRTCYEIKTSQPAYTQGTYIIDPSGLGKDPITVYCDSDGKTLISHDSEETSSISSCLGADCYTRIVTYEAKLQQMRSLTSISSECRQSFRYECTMAPLEYNGVQYSYWKDAYGNVKDYWAGPKSDSHTCQCGIERNCLNVGITCNCDSLSSSLQVDNGFITDKEALPVTELHFGRTQLSGSSGRYTLGKMECSGRSTFEGFPTGCRDLLQIGHVLNGFYPVRNGNKIDMIFCDFSTLDEDFETRVGLIDVKSSPVQFHVQRKTSFSTLNTPIPFEIERLNVGRAMDLARGIFTAPKSGIYYFVFSCLKQPSTAYMSVFLRLNGVNIGRGHGSNLNALLNVIIHSTLKLDIGDQISLSLPEAPLFDDGNSYTQFSGFLLEENLAF